MAPGGWAVFTRYVLRPLRDQPDAAAHARLSQLAEQYDESAAPGEHCSSARGETAGHIGQYLSCSDQTVRNAIRAFNKKGLASLQPGSSVAHHIERAFDTEHAERLRALLHQSPRNFGKPTSLWTLALAAEVSFAQGLTPERVSAETVRATLARLGIGWRRAKQWISSPDPEYARKKTLATG